MTPRANFSIFICTRNRADLLRQSLAGLTALTQGRNIPIAVIDNGSADNTAEVVGEFGPGVRCVKHLPTGLSHARNRAVELCETEYLVFLDDDGIPETTWLTAVESICSAGQADIFGGPYTPFYTNPKPQWFDDSLGSAHLDLCDGWQPAAVFLTGANMGFRKAVVEGAGGFRSDLGITGNVLRLGEETALQAVLRNSRPALKVWFSSSMCIRHHVSKDKMHLSYIARRSYIYGRQLVDINPSDPLLRASAAELLLRTKFGLPLLLRIFRRTRAHGSSWKSYASRYLSLNAIFWGIVARRIEDMRPQMLK